MSLLERGQWPTLRLEPGRVAFGPRFFGGGKATTVAEQEFRQTMPRTEQIGANVFATSQEISRGFFLFGGNVNGGERAGAVEDGELACIATVGFDAIARAARDQRWGDDVTGNAG